MGQHLIGVGLMTVMSRERVDGLGYKGAPSDPCSKQLYMGGFE